MKFLLIALFFLAYVAYSTCDGTDDATGARLECDVDAHGQCAEDESCWAMEDEECGRCSASDPAESDHERRKLFSEGEPCEDTSDCCETDDFECELVCPVGGGDCIENPNLGPSNRGRRRKL